MTLPVPIQPSPQSTSNQPSSKTDISTRTPNNPSKHLSPLSSTTKNPTPPSYPSPKSMNLPPISLGEGSKHLMTPGSAPPPHPIRRESFHFGGDRPHPPPLRTAFSAIGLPTTSSLMLSTSSKDEEKGLEKEELTTKGRKRKRLAKACSACHKNKRRCDGFAPCSNCEFSNRPCLYLNAQGDPIPPPRTRDSSSTPAGAATRAGKDDGSKGSGSNNERRTSGDSNWSRRESFKDVEGESSRRPMIGPIQAVEADPSLSAELVDIFFKRCLPLSVMLHAPTFHYRLYLNQVSPILLDMIYAIASRLCENPAFLATFPAGHAPHLRGELFARRAHSAAERLIEMRKIWNEEERRMDRGTWQETELAQASYLLSIYFSCLKQPKIGLFYLDSGIDILRPTSKAYIPPPAPHLGLNAVEYTTLMETRNRTFWMFVFHDLCAAANGRPRRLSEADLGNIPLPGTEVGWARWGGSGIGGREPGRRDGLVPLSGNWPGDEGRIGEFGQVIRILSVFAEIMLLAIDTSSNESKPNVASRLESALKSWAMSLPSHLHFNEHNLATAVGMLNSPVVEIKATGWMYAYMHAVAECGMFYLQAVVAQQTEAGHTAQRQSQAVENLTVIMDTIGKAGREGCCFLFPLFVVSNWQEHLKMSNLVIPSPQQIIMEERLSIWWAEMKLEWGVEQYEMLQRGIYSLPNTQPTMPSPSLRVSQSSLMEPPPPSSLGLYQTSPARVSMDSAVSPTSTMSIATPNFNAYHHRFSLPSLPPLRPRAVSTSTAMSGSFPPVGLGMSMGSSGKSPSPPGSVRHRHLPSMSSLSDSGSQRDRERESHKQEPISLPPINSDYRFRDSPSSPRHHPYARESVKGLRSPRMSWGGPSTQEKSSGGGGQPQLLGIAALVSAAEKEREKRTMTAV
ncbi:hypothetical protein CI109_105743 [Kwoniella shandongensis]|uniref:Uncharacterized protein n=1 Tax=Kwoniella shandongensis TaxID=1734106 RepID=A0A5M6C1H4_9TREE|nr:uncharacterized protein CI109_003083 [Kwoniella shandongensis]KAA5528551.1 hypothetical protein CI109_003083 [Kwoniella shandongensis]